MRHRINRQWPRRSKKFDGFERVSLHNHTPDRGEDKTEIHYALLDPVGAYCIRRSHFENPGRRPFWGNLRLREIFNKLPFDIRWSRRSALLVKVWLGDRPKCIQPFKY